MSGLRRVRVWLGHALLAAFVLKALIPSGFMPEFSGGDGGSFKIVICTANGSKFVDVDGGSAPQNESLAKHTGEPCALGAVVALPAPDQVASVALPMVRAERRTPSQSAVVLPPARAGPAHSPRAPPFRV